MIIKTIKKKSVFTRCGGLVSGFAHCFPNKSPCLTTKLIKLNNITKARHLKVVLCKNFSRVKGHRLISQYKYKI